MLFLRAVRIPILPSREDVNEIALRRPTRLGQCGLLSGCLDWENFEIYAL